MAKNKKKTKSKKPYGAGKSVSDIITGISRNISRVTETTIRSAVSRLSSAMNKRLDRAEKSGVDSPAIRDVRESGGRFSTKGKGLEALKAEFIRIKNFYTSPSSTQKGWKDEQAKAEREARKRGVLPPPTFESGSGSGVGAGQDAEPEPTTGWAPPEGWVWDEETRSWSHPDYGSGWLPYEGEGGGLYDPITDELVGNTARSIHDYDASQDPRRFGAGTEAGKLWEMVDSISKIDPRFTRRESYLNPAEDPRMALFSAIDDAWASSTLSFEQARDLVLGRLDDIYEESQSHVMTASSVGFSSFFSDEDDW